MSFQEISSKIIKEAINSAVYIDDKVLLPFENKRSGLIDQSDLFHSFRKNSCYLDFYRYVKSKRDNFAKILSNKDLLILDWHLSRNEEDLSATFEILKLAINTQCLHFSVIYTDQDKEILSESVILNVGAFFSGLDRTLSETCKDKIREFIDSTGWAEDDQTKFANELKRLSTELFFEFNDKDKHKEISIEINKLITPMGRKEFVDFLNGLELPTEDYKKQLVFLSFILNDCYLPEKGFQQKTSVYPDRNTVRINHLFIKAISKKSIDENELYDEFTNSLTTGSNIFLTLLGLEMRNRFRETSGFIGKELDDLSQLAFFYHRSSHFGGYEELFNEFLKDIWKDQVASFLLEKNIELFGAIDEFKDGNNIDDKLAKFTKGDEKSREDLAKLNFVYNRLAIKRKKNDEIRFGDIFLLNLNDDAKIYLLCLTQHCDCLRPEKIKNMFFFVEGEEIGITKGVDKSDGDFISFIENSDKKLTCIDWTNGTDDCKPFTFYIKNTQMKGEKKTVALNYKGENRKASYLCTLKENYAQRIANKAFSYPLRVGIDFATFKLS